VRVVLTGAGPGSLGLATACALRDLGHEVVVSTRAERVDGFGWHRLDLADRGSVAAFAAWVLEGDRPLDALVNNAGIHLDLRRRWSAPQLVDGHEIHWRTNYLGSAQLTRALLPALLAQADRTGDARVVNVVSKLHTRGSNEFLFTGVQPYDSWAAYGTSKLALMHDAAQLSRRYGDRGLRAVSVHPGSVFTRVADAGLATSPLLARLRTLGRPIERRMLLSLERGAETTVFALTDPEVVPGGYYTRSALAVPSDDALDDAVGRRLADQTGDWLG
jgi:NAD(P)-dependent dehydrogenase (short-subunit alcohol dehydrogenase family)